MHVSPDLDSILYALAGLNDEERGWGRADETWNALDDRRRARRRGVVPPRRPRPRPASRAHAGAARGRAAVGGDGAARARARRRDAAPARDRRPPAHVDRDAGGRVHRSRSGSSRAGIATRSTALRFEGAETAAPAPGVLEAIDGGRPDRSSRRATRTCSIAPILAVAAIRDALARRRVPCVAVSPLIGGRAVKGPADRMLARLAGGTSPAPRRRLLRGA